MRDPHAVADFELGSMHERGGMNPVMLGFHAVGSDLGSGRTKLGHIASLRDRPGHKETRSDRGQSGFLNGGAKGTRTPDPHTASVVRYQLRHSPVFFCSALFKGTVKVTPLPRRRPNPQEPGPLRARSPRIRTCCRTGFRRASRCRRAVLRRVCRRGGRSGCRPGRRPSSVRRSTWRRSPRPARPSRCR